VNYSFALFIFSPRVQDLESHSKLCYSASQQLPSSPTKKAPPTTSPKFGRKTAASRMSSNSNSLAKHSHKGEESEEEAEFLVVNVTRSSQSGTDVAPFKIVTKVMEMVAMVMRRL